MAVLEANVQVIEQVEFIDPAELQTEYLHSLRRLSLDDYHWLIERGYFERNPILCDPVELIDGYLVEMSPNHPPHAFAVNRLSATLLLALHERAFLRTQSPITLKTQQSEPEPDVVVVEPPDHKYMKRHPGPDDIFLVCEVADSSLAYDRKVKLDLYARAGIGEYWIINLNDQVLEVYRQPVVVGRRAAYQVRLELLPNQRITPLAFPDVEIALSEIFPEREAD